MDPPTSSNPPTTSLSLKNGQITSKRSPHTSLADLPPEILTWILFFAVEPFNFANLQHHQTLASVCRLWRDVIIGTPIFWVYIKTTEHFYTTLRLSAASPLYVEISRPPIHIRCGMTDQIMRKLMESRERWRSLYLELRGPTQVGLVRAALQQSLPLLEDVFLWEDVYHSNSPPSQPFTFGNAPNLRSIFIQGVFPILRSLHSSLTSLEIRGSVYPPADPPTANALGETLAACPNLRSLDIRGVYGWQSEGTDWSVEPPDGTPMQPLAMPCLEKFWIGNIPSSVAVPFLRSLNTPPLKAFSITWDYDGFPLDPTINHDRWLWIADILPRFVTPMFNNRPPKLISLQIDNANIQVEVDNELVLHIGDRRKRVAVSSLMRGIVNAFDMGKYPVELLFRARNNAMPLVKELAILPADTAQIVTLIPWFRKAGHIRTFFKLLGSLHTSTRPGTIFPAADRMDVHVQVWDDPPPIERRVARMLQHFNRPKSKPLGAFRGPDVFDRQKGKFVPYHGQPGPTPVDYDVGRMTRFLRSRKGSGSSSSNSGSESEPDLSGYSDSDSDSDYPPEPEESDYDYQDSDYDRAPVIVGKNVRRSRF